MRGNLLHELARIFRMLSRIPPNSIQLLLIWLILCLCQRTMMRSFLTWKISIFMKGMRLIPDSVLPSFTYSR